MARKPKSTSKPKRISDADRIATLEARVMFLEQGLARKDAAIDILTMSIAVIGAQIAKTAKGKRDTAGLKILMKNIADLKLCVPRADEDGEPEYLSTIEARHG